MSEAKIGIQRYFLEFITIFLGVTFAFALDQWNENRKLRETEMNTLRELKEGLNLDIFDIRTNINGHKNGIKAVDIFNRYIRQQTIPGDSLAEYYGRLFRDFISVQNSAAYESLKSSGLNIITNDSLRIEIVTVYDFLFEMVEKLEEEYQEMQYFTNYYAHINDLFIPAMIFDDRGNFTRFRPRINLTQAQINRISSYLWRIKNNRQFILEMYKVTEVKIQELIQKIDVELTYLN